VNEIIYTWILIKKSDNTYLNSHRQIEKPKYGNNGHETDSDPDVEWIEWNKPLPDDIDTVPYKYEDGELKAV
jgi:hypothetical protein